MYEFLATVCGVKPTAPGFSRVKIEPHLGERQNANGRVPGPAGTIEVKLERNGDGIRADITLPGSLTGSFVWQGKAVELRRGSSSSNFKRKSPTAHSSRLVAS